MQFANAWNNRTEACSMLFYIHVCRPIAVKSIGSTMIVKILI